MFEPIPWNAPLPKVSDPAMKPHIWKNRGLWYCSSGERSTGGAVPCPKSAYRQWLWGLRLFVGDERRWRGKDSGVPPDAVRDVAVF